MTITNLVLPNIESTAMSRKYAKFLIGPLERGYGTTIGNSLRRVLLASLPGASITSIRVTYVPHEFSAIPHVREDMMEFILQVKQIRLKLYDVDSARLRIEVRGAGVVTAADIVAPSEVEIINPDLHIATLTKEMRFFVEMEVARGRGYVPAERNKKEDSPIGVVAVDSSFSPVKKVNYAVEETRVGQMTDYDRLVIEVWTNGAATPEEALLYASNILQRHLDIFVNYGELPEEEVEEEEEEDKEFLALVNKPITELELSVRSANCLEAAKIKTIGDLIRKTEAQMLKYKNFGKKSLSEIQGILTSMGLHLGMDVEARLKAKKL